MAKTGKSWRMDNLAAKRLEQMSKETKISQTQIIEELIHACFDEHCNRYQFKLSDSGFDRLMSNFKHKLELYQWENI